jgi:tRNA pseudouridine38-40 synthase
MDNYKITLQYDGTKYKGWQVQKSTPETIQGKLQNILSRLCGKEVEVIGSGRTDAGVHAKGQVANFHIELPQAMSDHEFLLYINRYLPEDIAVTSLKKVEERFHARFSAMEKTYRYRIHVSPIADVFEKRYVYTYLDLPLDTDAMRQAAALLIGRHDFKSFCGNKHMKKSTVRTVSDITISEIKDENGLKEIVMDYTGDGFLQNMIRIMTGTLIEVGSGRRSPASITQILEAKDREEAGYTAPGQGLCLLEVKY